MPEIKTYLINMNRDKDRLLWMQSQLAEHDVQYERFSAVDGRSLSQEQQAYADDPNRSHLSKGEIGCLLSHFSVWRLFLATDSEFALILEDDLHFASDFAQFFKSIRSSLESDDAVIHRLEAYNAPVVVKRPIFTRIGNRLCRQMISNLGGTGAYILNRKAAELLVNAKAHMTNAVDIEMFNTERRVVRGLVAFQWFPAPLIQDLMHGGVAGYGSSLAGTRSDERAGLLRTDISFKDRLKSIGRPTYTALYDLLLLPLGKARKVSKFG